ncbi:magnesium transporter [Xanthobacter tagetidis]|uniref:Magnesium transporter MgtE n=1 Tax=Xanthobacter tagetidis TaxID=60216 RepID=A0A3L7AFF6_9HYPH|nr:magnesium transporter [Xanthobacter tagetidis]MBB6305953.1 magnesium transporter [Xanthobacter tagetidis]RLP78470.1 magnesium transporter [Xanthobacter tagetidis]
MNVDRILQGTEPSALVSRLGREHVADIVEFLNSKSVEEATEIIAHMPLAWGVEVLDQPPFRNACEVIEALPEDKAAAFLEGMSSDRVADVLRWIEEPKKSALREALPQDVRAAIDHLLTYPENTAGALMTTEFVSVPSDWSVKQTLDHIREVERTRETVYAIFVLHPASRRLTNVVTLRRLIFGGPDDGILTVAQPYAPITVAPNADSEDVARTIRKYDLLAVPVVDTTGHILGIVTVDDVIDSIITEQTEEVQRMGGMEAIDAPYLDIGFFQMIKKRAGWLCVLFLSEMLTTSAMQVFSDELEKAIVLALFIPLVMSSGGNSGSQATSLIIRALALQEVRLRDWWRVAVRELPTGIVLGAILGVIGVIRIAVWQEAGIFDYGEYWKLLAVTIGAALIGIVTFGSMAGSLLPFALKRLGFDPATASAPFIATLVDVTGIVIYFSVAWLFLHGTIL